MSAEERIATTTLEKVREELICVVCQEIFAVPKTLPCLHTFCESCLKAYAKVRAKHYQNPSPGLVECPTCRGASEHLGGVSGITTNFIYANLVEHVKIHNRIQSEEGIKCGKCVESTDAPAIAFCYDCKAALCDFCHQMHQRVKDLKSHNYCSLEEIKTKKVDLPVAKQVLRCQKHEVELRWYCRTCMVVICRDCTVKDHQQHEYDFIPDIISDEKEKIKSCIEPLKNKLIRTKEASAKVMAYSEELQRRQEERTYQIAETVRRGVAKIKEQGEKLQAQADNIFQSMSKNAQLQLELLETTHAGILSTIDFIMTSLEKGSDVELLMFKKDFLARCNSLQQMELPSETDNGTDVQYISNPDAIQEIGELSEMVCAAKCTAEGCSLQQNLLQGEESVITVKAYNSVGKSLSLGGNKCTVEVNSFMPGVGVKRNHFPDITDQQNGTYLIHYVPQCPGTNRIHVKFNDEYIQGSPFDVEVVRNYSNIKVEEPEVYTIPNASPWGLAAMSDQELAVSASDSMVHIFDVTTGDEVEVIQSNFTRPYGMAVDAEGYLWITDREGHNVQKFSRKGEKLLQFGQRGVNGGQFSHPRGIAIHPTTGKIYISDMKNNRIQIFSQDGQYLDHFGSPGKTQGLFNLPAGICFDRNEHLVVCDDHNCRLQLFDAEGSYIKMLGTTASQKGLLCSPIGVACDPHGRYIVTEFGSHCISFLSPEGEILNCIRTIGKGLGQFVHPRGVAVDSAGYIYIADNENMRIIRF